MQARAERNSAARRWSIYEVHIGSWMRVPDDGNRSLSYRELAPGWRITSPAWASRTPSSCP